MDSSLGYAKLLSERADLGGSLGEPETADEPRHIAAAVAAIATTLNNAKHVVAFTGAGISTSAGIPDFRGPNGVWTRQRANLPPPTASTPFALAVPSYTHLALLALHRANRLHYLCSQNVDCLHLRSGFGRDALAELHGNCFAERCERCGREVIRDFEVASVGFKLTGRVCTACGGAMRDQCLDWEDALPEAELRATEKHAAKADLALCLGTSLQIIPACDLPMRALRRHKHKPDGGAVVIVNLQPTPKDKRATHVVHAPVDEVMAAIVSALGLRVPAYVRTDALRIAHDVKIEQRAGERVRELLVWLFSCHGKGCPMPWLDRAEVVLEGLVAEASPLEMRAPGFGVRVKVDDDGTGFPPEEVVAVVTLHFAEGCNAGAHTFRYAMNPLDAPSRRYEGERREFVTCRVEYDSEAVVGEVVRKAVSHRSSLSSCWPCSHCTFVNEATRTACKMCRRKRKRGAAADPS